MNVTVQNHRTSRITACTDPETGAPIVFVPAVTQKTGVVVPSNNALTQAQLDACRKDRATNKLFAAGVLRVAGETPAVADDAVTQSAQDDAKQALKMAEEAEARATAAEKRAAELEAKLKGEAANKNAPPQSRK